MLIAVLSCSKSYCQSDSISSYTILSDSNVLVPIQDIRLINSKLVELKYLKKENEFSKQLIEQDSILINTLKGNIDKIEKICNAEIDYRDNTIRKIKIQRNTARITSIGSILLLVLSLFR